MLKKVLRWIKKGSVYEEADFSVSIDGPWAVRYSQPTGKTMRISSNIFCDELIKPYRGIFINQLRWAPPHEFLVIDERKRQQVRERVQRAMTKWKEPTTFIED